MKCEIVNGKLEFFDLTPTEAFAVKHWVELGSPLDGCESVEMTEIKKPCECKTVNEAVDEKFEEKPEPAEKIEGASKKPDTEAATVADETDNSIEGMPTDRDVLKKQLRKLGVEFNERTRVPGLQKLLAETMKSRRGPKTKAMEKVTETLKAQAEGTAPAEEKPVNPIIEKTNNALDLFDEKPEAEKPAAEAAPAADPELDADKIREALIEFAKKHGKTAAIALLNDQGADCVSDLKPADYPVIYGKALDL